MRIVSTCIMAMPPMPYRCCSNGIDVADHARLFGELIDCLTGKVRAPQDWRALIDVASATLTIGSLADAVLDSDRFDPPADVRDLLVEVRDRARRRNALLIPSSPRRWRRSGRSACSPFR